MAQLGELYEAIDNVKQLGLDVTDLLKQVKEKEDKVLSDEIIPSIKDVAGMLLQHFRRDIDITIHHKNGQPLSIYFSQPGLKEKKELSEGMNMSNRKEESSKKQVISTDEYFPQNPQKHLFYVKSKNGAHGKGIYDEGRKIFILLKGSSINPTPSSSMGRKEKYDEFVKSYCDFVDGLYVLIYDYEFTSPSAASAIVLGRSSNGWNDWKDNNGRSLGAVYRR